MSKITLIRTWYKKLYFGNFWSFFVEYATDISIFCINFGAKRASGSWCALSRAQFTCILIGQVLQQSGSWAEERLKIASTCVQSVIMLYLVNNDKIFLFCSIFSCFNCLSSGSGNGYPLWIVWKSTLLIGNNMTRK